MKRATAIPSRAVIYCRVSTGRQADNLSLDEQQRVCESYCSANSLTVVDVFTDAKSAKTVDRPAFQKMLAFCKRSSPKIDVLVVYDCTRFSRGEDDAAALIELEGFGTRFRSATESEIADTPIGKLMRRIKAALAAYHSDDKAQLTIRRMNGAARQGGWPWKVPIGYCRAPGAPRIPATLLPDEREGRADLVASAFDMFLHGRTKAEIHQLLVKSGLQYATGNVPTAQTIAEILENPVYAGYSVGKDPESGLPFMAEGNHDGLVSQDTFERVQYKLSGRT